MAMTQVNILIPTYNRLTALTMTLAGVAGQSFSAVHVIIADQSRAAVIEDPAVRSLLHMIEARGGRTTYHHRREQHGIAEQRHFLLSQARCAQVLFLDDDVWMEPRVLEHLVTVLEEEKCAFVGAFPAGLSFQDDFRPEQQQIEYWDGPVQPEVVTPEGQGWERWQIHRAANLYHIAQTLPPGVVLRYKIAWLAQCVLYDREKLLQVGGFSFWSRLPRYHSGEEVLVQNLLLRRWGGCGIVPSGTYSAEAPTTVLNSHGSVDGHALELLPEMAARYAPQESSIRGG